MYIYEQRGWPKFKWDKNIIKNLLTIRHEQGRLMGEMAGIGFPFSEDKLLETLTNEVVKSSEIEGEILDQSQVRSSVARHLGMDIAPLDVVDKNIEGVVEMVLDATQNFEQILTTKRLFKWHTLLFPKGSRTFTKIQVGRWRAGPVQVISGHFGRETVHFDAPPANQVAHEMEIFLNWLNNDNQNDPVLKAAIAHLWFVTIHPFDDGNGRIGRAIADYMLARSENSSRRFYSLSAQIQAERKSYYAILEKTQKGKLDITPWIEWFFSILERAIQDATETLDKIKHKALFWEYWAELSLNERQKKVINRLLEGFEGKLTTSKWAKMTKCSQDTAYRDIKELIEHGILIKNLEGGRSTSYMFIKPFA